VSFSSVPEVYASWSPLTAEKPDAVRPFHILLSLSKIYLNLLTIIFTGMLTWEWDTCRPFPAVI